MEYYSAIKNNEILPFAMTWIELESTTLSEISQSEKDKYRIMWSHSNVEFKRDTDEHIERGKRRKEERETNHKRLLMIENKLRIEGGSGGSG